jgi:hypothetical protein
MAIAAQNIKWFGQPVVTGIAQGSLPSQGGISGGQSRSLVGVATFILDGATTTGLVANFIDGVQVPFKTVILLPVLSVTAPATIGGVANQAVYSGVGAYGQLAVGQSVTFAGFANAGNNGTFTINALTTSTIQVTNASSVAETNPAGTVAFNLVTGAAIGGTVVTRSLANASGVADTAAGTIGITQPPTTLSSTGVTFSISAAGSNLQTLSVLVELFPNQ